MLEIYIANTLFLSDEKVFQKKFDTAPLERQGKINLQKNKKNKRLSLGAWLLLDYALTQKGIDTKKIAFSYNDKGKPFLSSHSHIHFNLSHSEDMVMCVISDKEVGCDIQKIRTVAENISDRYFHPDEAEFLNKISISKEKQRAFFRLWTLKESYIKALGLGFSCPMKSFCIDIEKDGAVLKTAPSKDFEPYFKEFDLGEEYCCACCSKTNSFATPKIIDLAI